MKEYEPRVEGPSTFGAGNLILHHGSLLQAAENYKTTSESLIQWMKEKRRTWHYRAFDKDLYMPLADRKGMRTLAVDFGKYKETDVEAKRLEIMAAIKFGNNLALELATSKSPMLAEPKTCILFHTWLSFWGNTQQKLECIGEGERHACAKVENDVRECHTQMIRLSALRQSLTKHQDGTSTDDWWANREHKMKLNYLKRDVDDFEMCVAEDVSKSEGR